MGFSYRKSFKAGPIRVTASKSGVSYSAGVKGARVTRRANGKVQTTLSAPGTGVRYTTSSGNARRGGQQRAAKERAVQGLALASIVPRQPPAGMPPLVFKGYLATVSLHSDRVDITRSFMGKITGNRSQSIPWQHIIAVDFRDPNTATNGYVHFVCPGDPRGLTGLGSGNRMAATARQPHALMFAFHQRSRYRQLRDLLVANAVPPNPPMVNRAVTGAQMTGPSLADELVKLQGLYQQGVLSQDEFASAKARLLGQ